MKVSKLRKWLKGTKGSDELVVTADKWPGLTENPPLLTIKRGNKVIRKYKTKP